jgi:hypothetical protein
MKTKRQIAVRKISAGERVRFHRDKKLVVDGENTARDCIFPRALKGKKRNLNRERINRIRNSTIGSLLFRKLFDLITKMSKHTSAATAKR